MPAHDGGREHLPRPLAWGGPATSIGTACAEARRQCWPTFEIDIPPDAVVRDLPVAQQQLVEIAKAMAAKASVIILDEPTTALGLSETEHLHELAASDARRRRRHSLHLAPPRRGGPISATWSRSCATAVSSAPQAETPLDVPGIITLMIGKDVAEQYPKVRSERGRGASRGPRHSDRAWRAGSQLRRSSAARCLGSGECSAPAAARSRARCSVSIR